MTYSVLILDDESLILEGLTKKIDWAALNCRVVGSALNGIEGKALMEQLRPDLVISDIRMPGLTGMALAELNYHNRYASKFIILSAYSDFTYAQQAIRYQVEDYILKPIDFNKLKEAVLRGIAGIEQIRSQEEKVKRLEDGIKNTQDLATASLLFNIARYSETAVGNELGLLTDLTPFRCGVFLCAKVYNLEKGKEPHHMGRLQSSIVKRFQEQGILIFRGSADDKLIFLCQIESRLDARTARDRIRMQADRILRDLGDEEKLVCTCAVSGIYKNREELLTRYQESMAHLETGFFAVTSGVIADTLDSHGGFEVTPDALLHHLKHGNCEAMLKEYQRICKGLWEAKDSDYSMHVLKELRHQAAKAASGAGMLNKPQMDRQYLVMNFQQLARVVREYLEAICQYIDGGQNLTGKVKLMVAERYGDYQFGLAPAADRLGLSSAYLSRLFKKETGENFVDYLVKFRIEKAMYLLETTKLKNSEISIMVGFEDERYFGKVFKKKCGLTPRQYREEKV